MPPEVTGKLIKNALFKQGITGRLFFFPKGNSAKVNKQRPWYSTKNSYYVHNELYNKAISKKFVMHWQVQARHVV